MSPTQEPPAPAAVSAPLPVLVDRDPLGLQLVGLRPSVKEHRAKVVGEALHLATEHADLVLERLDRALNVVDPLERDTPDDVVIGLVLAEDDDLVVPDVDDALVPERPLDGSLLRILVRGARRAKLRN